MLKTHKFKNQQACVHAQTVKTSTVFNLLLTYVLNKTIRIGQSKVNTYNNTF